MFLDFISEIVNAFVRIFPKHVGLIAVGNISEVKKEDNPSTLLNDNKEVHAVEQTLNGMEVDLEKKNLVNGNAQNETVSGAGGLGQGSPKVSSCYRSSVRLNFSR